MVLASKTKRERPRAPTNYATKIWRRRNSGNKLSGSYAIAYTISGMKGFSDIEVVLVPRTVLDDGQQFLRAAGVAGKEGMVLWAGKKNGATFSVTLLVIPQQRGIRTSDGVCVIIDAPELQRLNLELYRSGLQLIAQVHSHPQAAYHSETDDEFAIARIIGSLSLVVPNFAIRPFSLSDCAVYRLSATGVWEDISGAPAIRMIRIAGEGYHGAA